MVDSQRITWFVMSQACYVACPILVSNNVVYLTFLQPLHAEARLKIQSSASIIDALQAALEHVQH